MVYNALKFYIITNCDLKIITKTFANRMSKVLEESMYARMIRNNIQTKEKCEYENGGHSI